MLGKLHEQIGIPLASGMHCVNLRTHPPNGAGTLSVQAASKNTGFNDDAEVAPRKSRLLRVGLFGSAILVLVVGWAFGLAQINTDRALTLEASNNQLKMTATTLAKHIEAMIFDGVGAAAAGANEIAATDRTHLLSEKEMTAVLSRMLTGGDYVRSLFIVSPSLYVSARRDDDVESGKPGWITELSKTQRNTWVGKPLRTELGDKHVLIPIAKRVVDIRGESAWAGALFSVSSLDDVYRALPVEQSGVSITTDDAVMLIRIPINPARNFAGMDISNLEAHKRYVALPTASLAALEAPDPITGKLRQYAARRIEGYSAIAVAGRNVEDTLTAWRERTSDSLLMLSIASVVLVTLTIALYVLLQRRFQAIARSEQRFQLAVKATNDGIWEWEIAPNTVYYSPRYLHLMGFAETDDFLFVPESFWNRIHPDDKRRTELQLQRHLLHGDPYDVEFQLQRKSGEYRWFRSRGQAIWDEKGNPLRMAGSITYIHDRKITENSLEQARQAELHAKEEFAQHLLMAQEQERQRLANELHDSVGQNLSLIKNRALMMLQQADLPTAIVKHVTALESLAADVIAEVRTVAQNLRPPHIDELGLTNAIDSLLKRVAGTCALEIRKRIENVDDVIGGTNATHMFRIVQEAMNNVIKHSRAKMVNIVLERDIDRVRLHIADDGCGFDIGKLSGHGIGLDSLRERARILHADLDIVSRPGSGTQIHIELPIAEITNGSENDAMVERVVV